jgi:hypothetical protein
MVDFLTNLTYNFSAANDTFNNQGRGPMALLRKWHNHCRQGLRQYTHVEVLIVGLLLTPALLALKVLIYIVAGTMIVAAWIYCQFQTVVTQRNIGNKTEEGET